MISHDPPKYPSFDAAVEMHILHWQDWHTAKIAQRFKTKSCEVKSVLVNLHFPGSRAAAQK